MARPREFDPETALRDAGAQFWAKGYQATSIQDIAVATGVKPGSLYKAFGDKRALFLKCAEHYMKSLSYTHVLLDDFEAPLREAFRRLFEAIADSAGEGGRTSGCLVTNTAFELAAVDPDTAQILTGYLAQTERIVRYRLMYAQGKGEIAADRDVEALAAYLMTVIRGLLLTSRISRDSAAMRRAAEVALDALDPPA